MKHRPSRRSAVVLVAFAGSAIAAGAWLLVTSPGNDKHVAVRSMTQSSATSAAPTSSAARQRPTPSRAPHALTRPLTATASTPTPTLPGVHLPKRPTGSQQQPTAPKTSAPSLVQLPGITVGGRCSLPNFPARTSDGTAVICSDGTWHHLR
jgi:hypothetical protein